MNKPKFVSIETPYNSIYPWYQIRNYQYAIQCNTHASSLGDVTWTPHLCNTQFVKLGYNSYISDSLSTFVLSKMDKTNRKYFLGRDETIKVTNEIRKTKMDAVVCYTDYGISSGMNEAIKTAEKNKIPVIYRRLPEDLKKEIFTESIGSSSLPVFTRGAIYGFALYGLLKVIRRGR